MAEVKVINVKTGQHALVEQEDLAGVLKDGWRLETDEEIEKQIIDKEYGDAFGQVKAAALGLAGGASLGITDYLADVTGYGDQVRQYYKSNPTTAGISEFTGATIPLLFTGGTGTAAKLANATPVGKAVRFAGSVGDEATRAIQKALVKRLSAQTAEKVGKVAGRAVTGGVEGTLFSTGQLVSEAALGDTPLTGEKILAHLGMGAVLGGGMHTLLPPLTSGVKKSAEYFRGKFNSPLKKATEDVTEEVAANGKIGEWFRGFADQMALKGMGLKKANFKALIKKGYDLDDIAKTVREYTLKTGHYAGKPLLNPLDSSDVIVTKLYNAKSEIGSHLGKMYGEIDDILLANPSPSSTVDPGKMLSELEEAIKPIRQKAFGSDKKQIQKAINKEIKVALGDIMESGNTFGAALEKRKGLDGKIWDLERGKKPSVYIQTLRKFRDVMHKELMAKGEVAAGVLGDKALVSEVREAQRLYHNFYHLGQMAKEELGSAAGNRWFSLSDHMVGLAGAMSGGTHLGKGANAGQIVNVHAPNPMIGLGLAAANKLFREKGPLVGMRLAEKAGGLSTMESKLLAADSRIGKAIKAIMSNKPAKLETLASASTVQSINSLGFSKERDMRKSFEKTRDSVNNMVADPKYMLSNIAHSLDPVSGVAPNLTRHMALTSANGLMFLHDKMPKPKDKPSLTPLLEEPEVTEVDIRKWSRYVKAVHDPMSIIDDIQANRITKESVEAVRTVYPELYTDIQQRIVRLANENMYKFNYQQKANLSVLFELTLHGSLEPGSIDFSQQMMASEPEQGQTTGQGQQKLKKTGLSKLTYAEAARSEAQQIRSK
jgi:hypothetical protein